MGTSDAQPDLSRVSDLGGAVDSGGGGGLFEGEVFETRGRLSAASTSSGQVSVTDLDTLEAIEMYELGASSTLIGSNNRQIAAVIAAQNSLARFDVVGVGVWVWDHEDHFHLFKEPSALQIDTDLSYEGPVDRVLSSGGWIVAASPTGVGLLFERSIGNLRTDIDRSRAPVFRTQEEGAFNGLAAVARGHLVYATESGLRIREPGAADFGEPADLAEPCENPTGLAALPTSWVAACGTDYLVGVWNDESETFDYSRVALDESIGSPEELIPLDGLEVDAYAGFTDAGVAIVTAAGDVSAWAAPSAPQTVVPNRSGEALWVTAADGVRLLDPAGAMLGEWLGEAGAFAAGDGFGYIATGATVVELEEPGLSEDRTFELDFEPGSLVVTGMWPGGEPVFDL
ncbi:MAG: hypothetical protein AAF645_20335 [Myxococcota bacterium]